MARKRQILPILMALMTAVLACNLPVGPRVSPQEATITAAIKTVRVQLTGTAAALALTPMTATPTTSPTATVTTTPQPPTNTPVPPTAVTRCNWAEFVNDVTIPDGTKLAPGTVFTKTWRLKNIGTCTWTTDYSITFDNGAAMNAPASVAMPRNVAPGESVDISVNLTAPNSIGRQIGNWKLRNPASVAFGLGSDAQKTFYVQIEVVSLTSTPTLTTTPGPQNSVYDFTANFCSAEWRSAAGVLPCPGTEEDLEGFILRVENPKLQDGQVRNASGLFTHPQWVDNGAISGRYPSFTVKAGDRFRAMLACLFDATNCSVRYQLNYRVDGGGLQNFGQWDVNYQGAPKDLNLDLTPLAGKNIEFVLAVVTNGSPDQDWAIWWQPRITR